MMISESSHEAQDFQTCNVPKNDESKPRGPLKNLLSMGCAFCDLPYNQSSK